MNLSEKQQQFTVDVALLIQFAQSKGYGLTFGDAFRTEGAQAELVRWGSSRTMDSKHRVRLAVDFNLFINGRYCPDSSDYEPLGRFWTSLGNVWGGDWVGFKDGSHFEYGG